MISDNDQLKLPVVTHSVNVLESNNSVMVERDFNKSKEALEFELFQSDVNMKIKINAKIVAFIEEGSLRKRNF